MLEPEMGNCVTPEWLEGRELADISKTSDHAADAIGATASFPFDRMTVEHFRESFPRARWNDEQKAWFIPGKTASQRFERWLQRETANTSAHADTRGKDAYAFDPISSKYLKVRADLLEIKTPYSRTVVELLREVPFAAWDAAGKAWTVPFRSYEQLRRRWKRIEEAARRNEPDQKKARQAEKRGTEEERASRLRAAERRRRRHPLDPDNLPPLNRPVMTLSYGIVVFVECEGELAAREVLTANYPALPGNRDYVWGRWRPAELNELIRTWPARTATPEMEAVWRQPTIEELRVARKAAQRRSNEKKKASADQADREQN
jgi:hypothetical protein